MYVAFIVDVFSQRIVAWHASTAKATDLVMIPLRMALWQRDREGHKTVPGELIHHSDAQYTSIRLTEHLALEEIRPSIGSVGDAYDNVVNDEAAILEAIGGVLQRADQVVWAVDVTGTMSGLLLALLAAHGQQVKYAPGRTVNQMATAYRGEAKTDARDAYVIAETARHRGDLQQVEVSTSLVTELRLLVTHRTDLVGDRVRMVNRLRDVLSGYFPALERSFDYAHSRGALVLLTGYQTPQGVRRVGHSRLRAWLVKRKVRSADQIAATALAAAKAQHTVVPGKTSRPASWLTSPHRSWRSVPGSPSSTPGSLPRSARIPRPRSSSRYPAWGRSWAPS